MMPLVTICLPVFNNQRYLLETIHSIQNQTYSNIEIVAVDDCSRDGSFEILKRFESSNFIVHKNSKNLGMKGNWNRCLSLASGKYLKMMGADDLLTPTCIEEQVRLIETVDVDLVSSNRHIISASGRVLLDLKYPFQGLVNAKKALRSLVGAGRNIIGEPVVCLIRKDALQAIGGFSAINHYVIDIETWSKLINKKGFFAMPEFLCSFRISDSSTSSKEGLNQIRSVCQFIAAFSAADVGVLTKLRGYFGAITFGVLRNLIFLFSNASK